MEKTKVQMICDGFYDEWKTGETGYIDGYVTGKYNIIYACVVLDDKIVLVPVLPETKLQCFKVIIPSPL